jgi:hypothetical protein
VPSGPVLPAASVARTRKVTAPSGPSERSYERGLTHGAQSLTTVASRSRRHAVAAPASAVKVNDGVSFCESPVGPPVTFGAAGGLRSSVNVSLTSVDSFAESSLPRTLNV